MHWHHADVLVVRTLYQGAGIDDRSLQCRQSHTRIWLHCRLCKQFASGVKVYVVVLLLSRPLLLTKTIALGYGPYQLT